jgi:ATP synthase protein I
MVVIDLSGVRRLALTLVLGQVAVTLVVALLCLALGGARAAQSALLGGGIGALATLAMALVAFRKRRGDVSAERVLLAFYAGEALKLLVVIALFVAVLRLITVSPVAMLAAYGAGFAVYWIMLASALVRRGRVLQQTV